MDRWDKSQAKHELLSFIRQLNESVIGKKVPVENLISRVSIDRQGAGSISNRIVWEQGADRLRERPRAMFYGAAAGAVESGRVQQRSSVEFGAVGFQQVLGAGAQDSDSVPAGTCGQPWRVGARRLPVLAVLFRQRAVCGIGGVPTSKLRRSAIRQPA
ncbi:hypothetical protein AYI69_g11105 [Smittium culicis]|uniref:Uncharacterized protein n=1 Tax=Smittium culicis TaxID=133412 RepID=A0A1R1X134_9FUNG|nr:hypothetical protein AYI69_g11105 [Smittium culicis]